MMSLPFRGKVGRESSLVLPVSFAPGLEIPSPQQEIMPEEIVKSANDIL